MLAVLFGVLFVSAPHHDRPAFARADRNGDGVVAPHEAVAAGVPRVEARREGADDGQGLSRREWQAVDMRVSPAALT